MADNEKILFSGDIGASEKLDVDIIAPQDGLVFEDVNVAKFLDRLKELQCGSDLMDELY